MQDELNFRAIAGDLPASPSFLAGGDLWPRIAAAHMARRRTRRIRRFVGSGFAVIALIAVSVVGLRSTQETPAVDWQARAQALEMQLNEATASAQTGTPFTSDTEVELARVDRALQAAYDRGAHKKEILPLWRQRSELLSLLLAVRQQQLAMTHI